MKKCRLEIKNWVSITARATSQQNSPVEKKFDTTAGGNNSMMNAVNLSLHDRCKLFKEAFRTATLLDGLVLIIRN